MTPGDSFGDYRVVRRLGKGGMGEVWLLKSASGTLVAYDLGLLKMRKLEQDAAGQLQFTVSLPAGVPSAKIQVRIYNNSPVRSDWGGCKDASAQALSRRAKNGQQIVLDDCAAADYKIIMEADGCAMREVREKVAAGESHDAGTLELLRIREARFKVRPFSGGDWKDRSVTVNGHDELLLQDKKDELGNICDMQVTPYGVLDGIGVRFHWGPDSCVDYGVMGNLEFDRRKQDGTLPEPQRMDRKDGYFGFQVGHVYRFREESHWHLDAVLAFSSMEDVGGANGGAVPVVAVGQVAVVQPKADNRKIDVAKIKGNTFVKEVQSASRQLFPGWSVGSDYYSYLKVSGNWKKRYGYFSQALDRQHVLALPAREGPASFYIKRKMGKGEKLRMSLAMAKGMENCEITVLVNRKTQIGRLSMTEAESWVDSEIDLSAYAGKMIRLDVAVSTVELEKSDTRTGSQPWPILYFQSLEIVSP